MNKLSIILVLAVLAIGAWLWWVNTASNNVATVGNLAPVPEAVQPEVSPVADIDAELEVIDIGNTEVDFEEIDADLNQL